MNPISCTQVEPFLAEYIDGSLAGDDLKTVQTHLDFCPACTSTVEDMRVSFQWTTAAVELPVPDGLVNRILEQTAGPALGWRERFLNWVRPALRPMLQPMLEPRFAMGAAMAAISFSLMLRFAGVDVRNVQMADLSPTALYYNINSKVHLAGSRVVKYYGDLRVVYEIQSQLQALREDEQPAAAPKVEKKKETPRPESTPKQLNRKWSLVPRGEWVVASEENPYELRNSSRA